MYRRKFLKAIASLPLVAAVPFSLSRQEIVRSKKTEEWFKAYRAKYCTGQNSQDKARWAVVTNHKLAHMINKFNIRRGSRPTDWSPIAKAMRRHNHYFYELRRFYDLEVDRGWEKRVMTIIQTA